MPKVKRIDHVSIAVDSIDEALKFFNKLFDVDISKVRRFGGGGDFYGAIFHIGEGRIELLEPADPDGFLARNLKSRGPGVHHVTLEVESLPKMRDRLQEMGLRFWGEKRSEAGKDETFIHPKDAFNVLFQLVEDVWEVQTQD